MSTPYSRKENEFIAWYPLALTVEEAAAVWQQRRTGYYVHIPFCTAICDYCGFAVEKLKGGGVAQYMKALRLEISRYAASGRLARHRFICGHFGGGTPSAIDAEELMGIKRLIDGEFDVDPDAEVTVEVNPISFTLSKAEIYARGGVNRISFGLQSFNNRTLATIGRPHRAADVETTLDVIRQIGWKNYSLDLIYGVPGQTLEELRDDLLKAAATGAAHISAFRLEIIPMTLLKLREAAYQLPPRLSIGLLDEMDDLVSDVLTEAGYVAYGAFNYARPGYESIHNAVAFIAPQGEYIGFGNSSYSFIDDHVYCNHAEIDVYVEAVLSGEEPIALAKPVNALEQMSRFFVLGLKFFVVSRTQFIARFGLTPEQVFGDVLHRLEQDELIVLDGDNYVLTRAARRYVNNVAKEFFVGASRGMHQYSQFVSNLTVEQIEMYAERRAQAEAAALPGDGA